MPSVPARVMIVLLWLATTSYVVYREWLPRLGAGSLGYNQLLANRVVEDPANWIIFLDGKRVGNILTNVQPNADGSNKIWSRANFGGRLLAAQLTGSSVYFYAEAEVSPLGRLRTFTATLSVEGTTVRGTLTGEVKENELVMTLSSPELPMAQAPVRVPFDGGTPLASSLAPTDHLPGLWVGRTWVTHVVDPQALLGLPGFFGASRPMREVMHRVLGKETLVWNGSPHPCYVVEDAQDNLVGKTWVRMADDAVLKQEASFAGSRVTMVLESAMSKVLHGNANEL